VYGEGEFCFFAFGKSLFVSIAQAVAWPQNRYGRGREWEYLSVSSVWTWCEGNVCVSGLGVVQKRNVCLRSGHGVRGMCLCLRSGAVQKRNVCMMSSV